MYIRRHTHCPACPPAIELSGPDLCMCVLVCPCALPVGMTCLLLSPSFFFFFVTCLCSVQAALLGLRSIQQQSEKTGKYTQQCCVLIMIVSLWLWIRYGRRGFYITARWLYLYEDQNK